MNKGPLWGADSNLHGYKTELADEDKTEEKPDKSVIDLTDTIKVEPVTRFDTSKYKKSIEEFKTTIITKYPKLDSTTITIHPIAIEHDVTNNDKYILFASFDVNGVKMTEYTKLNIKP